MRCVVGEERRDPQRDPALRAAAGIEGGSKQLGRLREIFQRQLEEQLIVRQPGR
jgi:hypothetical protein